MSSAHKFTSSLSSEKKKKKKIIKHTNEEQQLNQKIYKLNWNGFKSRIHIHINIYIDAHMVMTRECTHDESNATKLEDWNDEENDLYFLKLGILYFCFVLFL
jgi:hypothetical protein